MFHINLWGGKDESPIYTRMSKDVRFTAERWYVLDIIDQILIDWWECDYADAHFSRIVIQHVRRMHKDHSAQLITEALRGMCFLAAEQRVPSIMWMGVDEQSWWSSFLAQRQKILSELQKLFRPQASSEIRKPKKKPIGAKTAQNYIPRELESTASTTEDTTRQQVARTLQNRGS